MRVLFVHGRLSVLFEPRDTWLGWFRGKDAHYICLVPCVAIRWRRRVNAD